MTPAQRSGRVARPCLLAGVVTSVVALALTACTAGPGESPQPTITSAPTTETPIPDDATVDTSTPAAVLAHYGLDLPADATDVVAEPREDDVMTDRFLVTFVAPAEQVAQMCRDVGIGDPLVAAALSDTQQSDLEVDGPPQDGRLCSASRPDDMTQQIRVLFEGDPADVRIAVYTMPTR